MPPKAIIRAAQPVEIETVRSLVRSCGLPTGGLEDQFETAFIVAEQGGAIVGSAGLERYGDHGLIRSVAVAETHRKQSIGRALVEECLLRAREQGLADIYLITIDAQQYFRTFGFAPVERDQVAASIAGSPEFASICPASATVMVLSSPESEIT